MYLNTVWHVAYDAYVRLALKHLNGAFYSTTCKIVKSAFYEHLTRIVRGGYTHPPEPANVHANRNMFSSAHL